MAFKELVGMIARVNTCEQRYMVGEAAEQAYKKGLLTWDEYCTLYAVIGRIYVREEA